MMLFWIFAAAMTLLGLGFVLVPLLRPRPPAGPDIAAANLAVLRSQRRELDADIANGILPPDARAEALADLVERARDDLAPAAAAQPVAAPRPWMTAAIVGVALSPRARRGGRRPARRGGGLPRPRNGRSCWTRPIASRSRSRAAPPPPPPTPAARRPTSSVPPPRSPPIPTTRSNCRRSSTK